MRIRPAALHPNIEDKAAGPVLVFITGHGDIPSSVRAMKHGAFHLIQNGNPKPIIFLTGHGDIPMSVQAMKAGAIDFLTKPVRDQTLLDAVMTGIKRDLAHRADAAVIKRNVELLETLTKREREVLHEVARGRVNKQIAFDLGISEVTVKLHRTNVMRKMQVASIGELVRIWQSLPRNSTPP